MTLYKEEVNILLLNLFLLYQAIAQLLSLYQCGFTYIWIIGTKLCFKFLPNSNKYVCYMCMLVLLLVKIFYIKLYIAQSYLKIFFRVALQKNHTTW